MLGACKQHNGYVEGNGYVVSWCYGHLIELADPAAYNQKYLKWNVDDLPIIPKQWKYEKSKGSAAQLQVLNSLMRRSTVQSLVNACDAGREGELIFRLVYEYCKCWKPVERLWISSMEDTAIRNGFQNLRPSSEYDALYQAALCRERADWIVGINATRLFSFVFGTTLNIGRVMTPTLSMLTTRKAQIEAFEPAPYWTIEIVVNGFTASSERFQSRDAAEQVLKQCCTAGYVTVQHVTQREKSESSPLLYDLTTLQRDANRLLGLTAQQTLDYAQKLYEHKLITYPRTDSRYLTDDMSDQLEDFCIQVAGKFTQLLPLPVNRNHVINSTKVSDHHALIPTGTMLDKDLSVLSGNELAILRLIAMRLLAAVSPKYQYTETAVELSCSGTTFKSKGISVQEEGWKRIECELNALLNIGNHNRSSTIALPQLSEGQQLHITKPIISEGRTSPPKQLTEDSLLHCMETAGVEDTPDDAERKGLGTPATRAGIIEKLVQKGFAVRIGKKQSRHLEPTEKGIQLISAVPEQLKSASMTAEWETRLLQIEHGELSPHLFMHNITETISSLCTEYKTMEGVTPIMSNFETIGTCPHCGQNVTAREKGWFCSNRQCRFVLWKDNHFFASIGKQLSPDVAQELLQNKKVSLYDCVSRRTGKHFNTILHLDTEDDGSAKYTLEFMNSERRNET